MAKGVEGKWFEECKPMKKVIFPLLGAVYLGLTYIGNGIYQLLYDEEPKEGVSIEILRPWERRQSHYHQHNFFR